MIERLKGYLQIEIRHLNYCFNLTLLALDRGSNTIPTPQTDDCSDLYKCTSAEGFISSFLDLANFLNNHNRDNH
jgi:hypothetical protein